MHILKHNNLNVFKLDFLFLDFFKLQQLTTMNNETKY